MGSFMSELNDPYLSSHRSAKACGRSEAGVISWSIDGCSLARFIRVVQRFASCERLNSKLSKKRKILSVLIVFAIVSVAFIYGQVDVATSSIKFDLQKIGESIYEARSKTGKWPKRIADLEGTEYLRMPYRREALESGLFVVLWQQDLDTNPSANKNRILAYDNGSLLSRLGWVWACRGDLSTQRLGAEEVRTLKAARQL